ncbi:MAG TPA: AIR synthase-related protein, partial [candidate division Zixibacteria bacterium]|nr:AIR synthase-related protein [candidate division Zixibacteria bacterium]
QNENDLGGTEYLKVIHKLTTGRPPRLNLDTETLLQKALLDAIRHGLIASAHDIADGGFAIALAECCIGNHDSQFGATVTVDGHPDMRTDALLFGETQSRIIVSVTPDEHGRFEQKMRDHNQYFQRIGVVGGDRLTINTLIDLPLADVSAAFYNSLAALAERIS